MQTVSAASPDSVFPASKGNRVLIVDDHPTIRAGVRKYLAAMPFVSDIREAGSVWEAVQSVEVDCPELVILDLVLGGRDGLDAIGELRRSDRGLCILVFSMSPEDIFARHALERGARGYLMKSADEEEFRRAVVCVLGGDIYTSPRMSARRWEGEVLPSLSEREMQVFLRLGEGKTPNEIADELNLSVKTVFTHRENLKGKFKAGSSADLARKAFAYLLSQGRRA